MKTAVIARARPWMRMLDVWCIVPGRNSAGLFGGSVAFGARVAAVVALQLQSDHACAATLSSPGQTQFVFCVQGEESGVGSHGSAEGSRRDCVLIKVLFYFIIIRRK